MASKFRYPQDYTWFQRDGTSLKLEDMTDTHLVNTHKMLTRRAEKFSSDGLAGFCYGGNPDSMASYYAEQAGSDAMDKAAELRQEATPIWDELKRRYPSDRSVHSYVERLSGQRVQHRSRS